MKTLLVLLGLYATLAATAAPQEERALIAYMKVKPGTERQFLLAAQAVIKYSRREKGNIQYQLHQSAQEPSRFVFYELFDSHEDLELHRNAPHTREFLAVTKPITQQFTLEEFVPVGERQ